MAIAVRLPVAFQDVLPSNSEAWKHFPRRLFYLVLFLSVFPVVLSFLGIEFGTNVLPIESGLPRSSVDTSQLEGMSKAQIRDIAFRAMMGGLHHGLLEWSSVIIALMSTILAFSHFAIKRDLTTPIIGVALYCCAIMDGFHTLVALRLINFVAPSDALIPFSWALARGFNAVMIILGALICFKAGNLSRRYGLPFIILLTVFFGTLAYVVIAYATLSTDLPQTQFPNAWVSRPYDTGPLLLYVLAAPILWMLYKGFPSFLTASLVIMLVPNIVLEAHMVFGSRALFDSDFNIAHGLKILAYFVPFAGLTLDYITTYRLEAEASLRLSENEKSLNRAMEELRLSNNDLETFAYVASHDLKSPLRAIDNLTTWLAEDLEGKIDAENAERLDMVRGRVKRMEGLLDSLLEFSRAGQSVSEDKIVSADKLVLDISRLLNVPKGFDVIAGDGLSAIAIPRMPLEQVFHNLINNALKHHDRDTGTVTVNGRKQGAFYVFTVVDDGPGIPKEYQAKIFEMFHTLKRRDEVEGSGMGLALVQKIILRFGGTIEVTSGEARGSTFTFYWPIVAQMSDASQV